MGAAMRSTWGTRPVCASCTWYALSSREVGPSGQVLWRAGDKGRCMNRESPTGLSKKQLEQSCRSWTGFGGR